MTRCSDASIGPAHNPHAEHARIYDDAAIHDDPEWDLDSATVIASIMSTQYC